MNPKDVSKNRLQEICQKSKNPLPVYKVISCFGESHEMQFAFEVSAMGHSASGKTLRKKTLAQQSAAAALLAKLGHMTENKKIGLNRLEAAPKEKKDKQSATP